jgi:pimeloyl-ACP methyl ester carboxylesterase
LNRHLWVIVVDLRGKGLSDKPETGYSMEALSLPQTIIGGHSFGGLVSLYLEAIYPEKAEKLVLLDAGLMNAPYCP